MPAGRHGQRSTSATGRPGRGQVAAGDPGDAGRRRRARRDAVHARDAPPRGPPVHGLAPRRQDLRHGRRDRQPPPGRDRLPRRPALRRLRPRRLPGRLPALLQGSLAAPRRRRRWRRRDSSASPSPELEAVAEAGTRTVRDGETEEVWRCQATEALKASSICARSRTRPVLARVPQRQLRPAAVHRPDGSRAGDGDRAPDPPAQAAAASRARPEGARRASRSTCSRASSSRSGPRPRSRRRSTTRASTAASPSTARCFRYCGRTLRVKDRVNLLIDETTGRMLRIPKDCLILEGSVCSGECSTGRWFCPREIYPFWREAWLRAGRGLRPASARERRDERCRRAACG